MTAAIAGCGGGDGGADAGGTAESSPGTTTGEVVASGSTVTDTEAESSQTSAPSSSTSAPSSSTSFGSTSVGSSSTGDAESSSGSTGAADTGVSHVVYLYTGHGYRFGWTPEASGPGAPLSVMLEPLQPVQAQTLVVSGLDTTAAAGLALDGTAASPTLLTGGVIQSTPPGKCTDTNLYEGATDSVDARVAEALAAPFVGPQGEHFARLGSGAVGDCNGASTHPRLSWSGPATLVPPLETLPAFAALLSPHVSSEVADELDALAEPALDPDQGFGELARRQLEMTRLAFEQDAARVATISIGASLTQQRLTAQSRDLLGHAQHGFGSDGDYVEELQELTGLVGDFALSLAETPYGDGSLLDHTLIVWVSDMSADRNGSHTVDDLPVVLIGNIDERVATGGHVNVDGHTLADLHMTVADVVDVELGEFGDPQSPPTVLEALLAD